MNEHDTADATADANATAPNGVAGAGDSPSTGPAAEPGTAPPADAAAESSPALGATKAPAAGPVATPEELEAAIVEALQSIYDPEIPVNIYELGLIYDIDVQDGGKVAVKMTLTSPACPVAGSLPGEVQQKVREVDGVADADVEVVWDPEWNPGMMSEAAKLQLGIF